MRKSLPNCANFLSWPTIYTFNPIKGLTSDEKRSRIYFWLPRAFYKFAELKKTKVFKKRKTVGIRVPDNNIARALVIGLGNPIISTSIRDEDELLEYTTDPELIFEKWHNLVDVVIDGGYGGNLGSTVIDLSGDEPEVLRTGKGDPDIV